VCGIYGFVAAAGDVGDPERTGATLDAMDRSIHHRGPDENGQYVDERCAAGQRLEYWTFARRDHVSILQPRTPLEEPLVAWTAARFAREPQADRCARKPF